MESNKPNEQQQQMMQQQQMAMMQDVVKGATPAMAKGLSESAQENPEMVQEMINAVNTTIIYGRVTNRTTEGVHQAGSPEHINEMLAKVDNPVQPSDVGEELVLQQATEGRPEWLPEKFGTPQDLLNAYNQLEQQYTQVSQQQEEAQQQEFNQEQVAEIQNASVPQVAQLLDERNLDIDVFQQEYNETGGIISRCLRCTS